MFRERHRMKLAIAAAMTMTMTMTGALATAQAMENAGFLEAQWHSSQIQLLAELQKERRRVIRESSRSVTTARSARAPDNTPTADPAHPSLHEIEAQPRQLEPEHAPGFGYPRAANTHLNTRVSLEPVSISPTRVLIPLPAFSWY